MAMESKGQGERRHSLILEGREKLSVSGVVDVQNFDETLVSMETPLGLLQVRGTGLHIERLSLEGGELELEGEIDSMEYEDGGQSRGGLLSRIFG